jgi:diguanylate cyclase (GGDEF)-like protein
MSPSRRVTVRLFAVSALVSVVPIIALGFVLGASYRAEARRRGVAEGRTEAELIAQTAIEPFLAPAPLTGRLRSALGSPYDSLARVTSEAVRRDKVSRLRIRNLAGDVVFSDDGSGFLDRPEDEAVDAANGAVVARLTLLNSDSNDSGAAGPEVVEVYQPLVVGGVRVGVLELYLPYAPIRADISAGLHGLFVDLVAGLAVLYVVLFGISLSVSRGLRRQLRVNTHLAEYDALTDLPNRRLFQRRIHEAVARRDAHDERTVAVAIIDLDRFKEVNDSLGHHNGDALLVELGRRLSSAMAPGDTVARLGGDEFGLIVTDDGDLDGTWSRIREVVGREVVVSGLPVSVEGSIGYAVAPADGNDATGLLQRADVALYVAKRDHCGIARYTKDRDHYDPANLTLISELRQAIVADELVVHYQPKARIPNGGFESVEALVRWQHPARGLLSPDRFLPLAEPTELIEDLTDWVLQRALTDVRDLHSLQPLGVAVNVSAHSLGRADFPDRVIEAVRRAGIAPSRLTIEITETALLADPERAAVALSRLDAFGVSISLDDFGTGQTSLAYLSTLPVDELKIDRSFVSDLLTNPAHEAIVRSVIDLGHNLGLRVVAEGIETRDVLDALDAANCDVAQGYHLARPMPLGDLPRFLANAGEREDGGQRLPEAVVRRLTADDITVDGD